MSSESMDPNRPKSAPEAPTEMVLFLAGDKTDVKLPPKPDIMYNGPILTAIIQVTRN